MLSLLSYNVRNHVIYVPKEAVSEYIENPSNDD